MTNVAQRRYRSALPALLVFAALDPAAVDGSMALPWDDLSHCFAQV